LDFILRKIFLSICFSWLSALSANEPVILVTGGAGYIGSHTCHVLKTSGFCPVAYDSLINGCADAVKWGPLVIGDINDSEKLNQAFALYKPIAVLHFAALRNIGESNSHPYEYYHTNVTGTLNLLNTMRQHGVRSIIFSSSCTVYGIA
jgi:UDP-glucose 4-epimerase